MVKKTGRGLCDFKSVDVSVEEMEDKDDAGAADTGASSGSCFAWEPHLDDDEGSAGNVRQGRRMKPNVFDGVVKVLACMYLLAAFGFEDVRLSSVFLFFLGLACYCQFNHLFKS